jgi:BMFP domain-containing protein YqiC
MRPLCGTVKAMQVTPGLAFAPGRPYFVVTSSGASAMSNGTNRILDELAKLMTDAAGAAQGVGREFESAFRNQAERVLNRMDLVQREEFEAVREMAERARQENEQLKARIAELEARLGTNEPA